MTETSQQPSHNIAPLWRRLMAMLYDTFLLSAVLFCTFAVYMVAIVSIKGEIPEQASNVKTGDIVTQLEPVEPGFAIYPLLLFVFIGFFTYFWRMNGQTLGMQVWKIKIISEQQSLSILQCIIRITGAFLSASVFMLGYLCLLWNKEAGTWHDRLSNSKIIDLRNTNS